MNQIKDKKASGIYKILNKKNGKFYIGSAKSLYYRRSTHFSNLNKNKHHNKPLQNSFNKHGKDNFVFIVLEYCELEKLIKREQKYIDELEPQYNICKIAGSLLGIKRSKETIEKIKKNHAKHNLGKIFSAEVRRNMSIGQKNRLPPSTTTKNKTRKSLYKPVIKYDLDMNFIEEYESLNEASLKNNISYKHLSAIITGSKNSKKQKFIFKYKK